MKNTEKHPQDILVDKIIERICRAKHGDNWENAMDGEDELTPFQKQLRTFYSPDPKHSIKLETYNKEMNECI